MKPVGSCDAAPGVGESTAPGPTAAKPTAAGPRASRPAASKPTGARPAGTQPSPASEPTPTVGQTSTATPPARAVPTTLEEAADALADAHRSGLHVRIEGSGTKRAWGSRLDPVELVWCSAGLAGIRAWNHDDLTLTVGPGTELAQLAEELAGGGQRLSLDPPHRPGATVGGVFAAADAGPLRHRYGRPRDLAIGATFALADGTVAHAGGKVIKNVAGYDLVKLVCGSLGTLAALVELTVRLHPAPEWSTTVVLPTDPRLAWEATRAARTGGVDPVALEWSGGLFRCRLEGTREGMDSRVAALKTALAGSGIGREIGATSVLEGPEEVATWDEAGRHHLPAADETLVRASSPRRRLPDIAASLEHCAGRAGAVASLASYPSIGAHDAIWAGEPEAVAAGIRAWRDELGAFGATAVVRDHPSALESLLDLWGPPPPANAVMAAVKRALDPEGLLSAGRFRPWW